MKRHYTIEDREIQMHCGNFRLDTNGGDLDDMLCNAEITQMNDDSEEIASFDFGSAPGEVQVKVEKVIMKFLAGAEAMKFKKGDRIIVLNDDMINYGCARGKIGTVDQDASPTTFVIMDDPHRYFARVCLDQYKDMMLLSDWEKLPELERLLLW